MLTHRLPKLFIYSFGVFLFMSCGAKKKDSINQEVSPICSGNACQSVTDWRIRLVGKVFPEKIQLLINGEVVLDECIPKQKFRVERDKNPQEIVLLNFITPKENQMKIEIFNKGENCDEDEFFLGEEKPSFVLTKKFSRDEVEINL